MQKKLSILTINISQLHLLDHNQEKTINYQI
jgi:hypothetical protein